jgi:creatinine amidohydrolase
MITQTAQTGPHLPVGSRYYIGEEIGRRAVRRLADDGYAAVLGAVLPFGHSEFNATYPGCIQLEPETLTQVIVEVARSLQRQGFRRIVLTSNAGGNPPAIKIAVHRLAQDPGLRVFYLDLQMMRPLAVRDVLQCARPRNDNHGGEWETSCILAIAPHLVDMSKAGCGYPDEADERNQLPFENINQHDRQLALGVEHNDGWTSPDGTIGDSTLGTAEKGHRILDNFADLIAGHIRTWVFDQPREAAQYGVKRDNWPKNVTGEPHR